eukprot:gnl/Trimastix_PCT/1667.p1 GENE.gnl/Trimastix_PCT/1667~~gnl/Trimastix_PCT/1667.p1  ORF type:complete len:369 (-),score=39.36 gnl/Trimastix_PCT/1667:18-1124(-)
MGRKAKQKGAHQQKQQEKRNERMAKKQIHKARFREDTTSIDREFSQLNKQLSCIGLRLLDVTGDGNCFFSAVSDQLFGGEHHHSELRSDCMDFVEANADSFAPFIEFEESFSDYVSRMRRSGSWAGNLELQAMSLCKGVDLVVHRPGGPRWDILNGFGRAIHLGYLCNEHYCSVRPVAGDAPDTPARVELPDVPPLPPRADQTVDPPCSAVPPWLLQLQQTQRAASCGQEPSPLEQTVMEAAGVADLSLVREVLIECCWDEDAAVEYLLAQADDACAAPSVPSTTTSTPSSSSSAMTPPPSLAHERARRSAKPKKLTKREKKERRKQEKREAWRARSTEGSHPSCDPHTRPPPDDEEPLAVEFGAVAI